MRELLATLLTTIIAVVSTASLAAPASAKDRHDYLAPQNSYEASSCNSTRPQQGNSYNSNGWTNFFGYDGCYLLWWPGT